ncbi:hypothetical protein C2G38_2038129 [Gigaspora rosea]|uniref:Uncharacterized protein n=1 Tax=Gigaspora rosea TaxID=44941 RepID=A0A397V7T0_9GLOM|nr:hypothetical protein C2G38_2038129 [Gigaspora rosea]
MSGYETVQAYTIYDETPKLSPFSAGLSSYHPTINYCDFRTTLSDGIISDVLNIVQSDIPTVVNYYDYRKGYNGDDCSPYLLSFVPYGQKNSVKVNYWDYRPNDYGFQSLSNVLKYIHNLTDIYYFRYVSESGDSTFLEQQHADHITAPEHVNHIIDSGQQPPIFLEQQHADTIIVPEQPVNHIVDSGEWPLITGIEDGHTYRRCGGCMKKIQISRPLEKPRTKRFL